MTTGSWIVPFCYIIITATSSTATVSTGTTTRRTTNSRRWTDHRLLEDGNSDTDTFLYNDLSKYSIRYEKCQFVKMYDDDLAADQEQSQEVSSSSPLATKHFVVYRLCPSDKCSSSNSNNACGSTDSTVQYGTYTMTVEEYLYYTVSYQKQALEQSCNFCNAYCLLTSSSSTSSSSSSSSPYCTVDCSNTMCNSCSATCDDYYKFTTAVANGDVTVADAANYIQCQKLDLQQDNNADDDDVNDNEEQEQQQEDDDAIQYYIGPYCQSVKTTSTDTAKTSISIGLFSDENCYSPVSTNIDMTQVLGGVTLSYHLFKHTTTTTSTTSGSSKNAMQCLTCLESSENNNNADNDDFDDVNEMCENLYTVSAKCESTTGLQNGFIQMHRNDQNNDNNENDQNNEQQQQQSSSNQVENEFMACTFIQSLLYNSYTETGVINIRVAQDYIQRQMTHQQQTTLVLLSVLLVGIGGAMYYYHNKIQQLQQSTTTTLTNDTVSSSYNGTNSKKTKLLIRAGELS